MVTKRVKSCGYFLYIENIRMCVIKEAMSTQREGKLCEEMNVSECVSYQLQTFSNINKLNNTDKITSQPVRLNPRSWS